MKKLTLLTFIIILLNIFLACKPSEETEQRRFESNMTELTNRSKRYPNLSKYFRDIAKEAGPKWDNALQVQDKEKRAQEMANVNRFITSDRVYSEITSFESRINSINYKIRDINSLSTSGRPAHISFLINRLRDLRVRAERDLSSIIREVERASFPNETSTIQDLNRVNQALYNIERDLRDALSEVERRIREDREKRRNSGLRR